MILKKNLPRLTLCCLYSFGLAACDKYAKKQGETIMDLESQTVVTVKNPNYLGCKGFDDLPYVSIKIKYTYIPL